MEAKTGGQSQKRRVRRPRLMEEMEEGIEAVPRRTSGEGLGEDGLASGVGITVSQRVL